MKILALGLRGFPGVQGGIENHCEHLYPRLATFGCDITVLGRSPYIGKKPYVYKNVKIEPLWSPRHKSLEAILHTGIGSSFVKKYRPDIVHVHAIGPGLFVPIVKMSGVKVVATHHGFDYDRAKWGSAAKKVLRQGERNLCKADHVIAVSKNIRETLIKKFSCQVTTIPNGVDLPEILSPGKFCIKWGLEQQRFFLFTGRLVPEKRVQDIIMAFAKIQSTWKLVIAGAADHEDAYSRSVKKLAAETNGVVMTGFVTGTELKEIYSNAGGFVLPSSHEGLPIALLEALSYGLPCIVSDIPANREIHHATVRTFPVSDCATLHRRMAALIAEKDSVHDKAAGRAFVATEFNWDRIAGKTFEVLSRI